MALACGAPAPIAAADRVLLGRHLGRRWMTGAFTLPPAEAAAAAAAVADATAIAGDATESGPLDPGGGIESRSDGPPQRSCRARSRPWRSSPCLVGGPGAAPAPPPLAREEGN